MHSCHYKKKWGLFSYYLGLKLLLSHLPKVAVFSNFFKSQEKYFRTPVKYHEFKNLHKIPWVISNDSPDFSLLL